MLNISLQLNIQIRFQILHMLQANRNTYEIIFNARFCPSLSRDTAVRSGSWMRNRAFSITKIRSN